MSLNYRSLFEVPTSSDPALLVRGQFRQWLRLKQRDSRSTVVECDWGGPGTHRLGENAWMTESADDLQDGSKLLRLTLEETNEGGRWITTVTAADRPSGERWARFVWVETSSADDEAVAKDPKPPRLIRNLLDEIDGTNGKSRMSSRPYVVRGNSPDDVDELVDVIRDDARLVPIVVAGGIDDAAQESWIDVTDQLTFRGVGLLSAVVLDGSAVDMINDKLGSAYAVPHGGVRTYHRGVRTDDESDALRHRFITPSTMNRIVNRDALGRLRVEGPIPFAMAWNARRAVLDAGLPREVRRVDTILRRASAEVRIKTAPRTSFSERLKATPSPVETGAPASAPQPVRSIALSDAVETPMANVTGHNLASPAVARLLEFVGDLFSVERTTEAHIERFAELVAAMAKDLPTLEAENEAYKALMDGVADENEQFRDQLERAQASAAQAELDATAAEVELRQVRRDADWYRRQLVDAKRFEALAGPTEPEPPQNLTELLDLFASDGDERAAVLERVVFTGDRSVTEQLLRYDDLGRVAGSAWDVLLVLGDYAAAKIAGESLNLHAFLENPPAGRRTISRHRFRSAESQTVSSNKKWRAERTFPVPETVDPAGAVFMDAHFALGGGDTVAPRLHFHDAVDRDGMIYVGYIGRHLTNTKS